MVDDTGIYFGPSHATVGGPVSPSGRVTEQTIEIELPITTGEGANRAIVKTSANA